jgi:hypothetical protein
MMKNNPEMMYVATSLCNEFDESPDFPIIKVQAFKTEYEGYWDVPSLGEILYEGMGIFSSYEEAQAYQNNAIESMISKLRKIQEKMNSVSDVPLSD